MCRNYESQLCRKDLDEKALQGKLLSASNEMAELRVELKSARELASLWENKHSAVATKVSVSESTVERLTKEHFQAATAAAQAIARGATELAQAQAAVSAAEKALAMETAARVSAEAGHRRLTADLTAADTARERAESDAAVAREQFLAAEAALVESKALFLQGKVALQNELAVANGAVAAATQQVTDLKADLARTSSAADADVRDLRSAGISWDDSHFYSLSGYRKHLETQTIARREAEQTLSSLRSTAASEVG